MQTDREATIPAAVSRKHTRAAAAAAPDCTVLRCLVMPPRVFSHCWHLRTSLLH